MFEKDKAQIRYTRDAFTFEEKMYEKYIELRKVMHELESMKYGSDDKLINSEDFKQGFIAGVKVISSILLDI